MLFSKIAVSAFLFAHCTFAALSPQDVVTNINIVATISGDTNSALSQVTTSMSGSQVSTASQSLVNNFNTIINDLKGDVTAMQATPPFPDGVTQPIVDALRNFVFVHQALLSTVIGKHGIFAQFSVTAPILDVLRTLEATIDSFAFAMIDLIPTRTSDVQTDKSDLDQSVGNSITTYEQICVPSPLYPAVMPVCASP